MRPIVTASFTITLAAAGFCAAALRFPRSFGPRNVHDRSVSLDVLLGKNERKRHAARLAQRSLNGKSYSWEQYARWGKELVSTGRIQTSPFGGSTKPLALKYRCVHCHNFQREDMVLSKQDADARVLLVKKQKFAPEKRDGNSVGLTPATTLWGAVNRESFYNGYYSKYHHLRLANGQKMNPRLLSDAVQVCCRYCSCGRFVEPWELDSIMTYLWDRELRLQDLNLPAADETRILAAVNKGDVTDIANARKTLRRHYLVAADAEKADFPVEASAIADKYSNGVVVKGNAKAGMFLYRAACAGCHGTTVHRRKETALLKTNVQFHRFVLEGTEGDRLYMPFFSKQRMTRQQVADIRAYLIALKKE